MWGIYFSLHWLVIFLGPSNDATASISDKRASPVLPILLTNVTAFTQSLYSASGHCQHSRKTSLEYCCKLLFLIHSLVSRLKNSLSLSHFLQYFLSRLIPWNVVVSHAAHVFDVSDS